MSISRFQDWPERLAAFLRAEAAKPFRWGTADCVTMAAGAVLAVTGVDPIESIRGTWKDERGALAAIGRLGPDLGSAVGAILEARGADELVSVGLAGRGDIVTVRHAGGLACGVVAGPRVACRAASGFAWLRLAAVDRAWRI